MFKRNHLPRGRDYLLTTYFQTYFIPKLKVASHRGGMQKFGSLFYFAVY